MGLDEKLRYTFALASIGLIGTGIFHSKLETEHLVFAGTFFVFSAVTMLLEFNRRREYLLLVGGLMPFVFIATFSPIIEHIAVAGILLFVLYTSCMKK